MHFGAFVQHRANDIDLVNLLHRRIVNQRWQLLSLAVLTLFDDLALIAVLLGHNHLHAARRIRHQIELLLLLATLAGQTLTFHVCNVCCVRHVRLTLFYSTFYSKFNSNNIQ